MDLTGYELESLRDDGDLALYRVRLPGNPASVLALVAGRSQSSIARLEHEYALAAVLDPLWAARPLTLDYHSGPATLLLEDNGGAPLVRSLGRPLQLMRFLRLATNLVVALGQVHRHGLIHKDIKPANLLVDAADNVWLTGFGIASRLSRERQQPAPPEVIAGTLAYMAPEQTGRMNRSIDARSDLYSLGVTLYEMLTGALPFTASDPIEWIHCHIARRPTPPSERVSGIPEPIDNIVLRLLAKSAEDRYQTAAGVEADLRYCLTAWEAHRHIDAFPLGTHDVPDVLRFPEGLYGREEQVGSLIAAFDRVVSRGGTELVLVSGYSGIGKSSVVNELHKAIVPPRGLIAAGKFDQYKRDVPYATLVQAFQGLVREILGKSDLEITQWRSALQEALGPNAQLMVNLIPELEFVIGEQPPALELSPQDAPSRFQMVLRRFLGVFAKPEHPLVLFLDDLQWLDPATLALLADLATQSDACPLLLVGAYRDNEVDHSHPLMRSLDVIRKAGVLVQEIVLAPLTLDDVGRLIADALHCGLEHASPLAQLVYEKTGGNPFFAIQFLTALAEEKLLTFDVGAGAWIADVERIRAKGYTDNVVDLMVAKLARLPDETQKTLTHAACLGNVAKVATLSLIRGQSAEAIRDSLREAEQAGFVFHSEDRYVFLHDRMQEAAYSLISQEMRAEVHLHIGRMLASRMTPTEIADQIFEVVNQLNRGSGLLMSLEEREMVASLNLTAGVRAKGASAYASALSYLTAGAALVAEDCWARQYELAFALELNRAECEFLTGDLEAAEKRLSVLSRQAANLVDQAAVTCLKVELYTTLNRMDRAVAVCLEYLRNVGLEWSAHPAEQEVRREYERIWGLLGNRSIEGLVDLPLMSEAAARQTMDVLTKLMPAATFSDENLSCLIAAHMTNLSLEHGNTDASCCGYIWLGMIMGPYFGDYPSGFRFGQLGVDLVDKRGLDNFKARVYLTFGEAIIPWMRDIRSAQAFLERTFETGTKIGDLTYAAYSFNSLVTNVFACGAPLGEVEQVAVRGLDYAQKLRFGLVADIITAQQRLIRTLRGMTREITSFNDADFDEAQFEQELKANPGLNLASCWYSIRKLQARVYAQDYSAALEAAAAAQDLLWTSRPFFEHAEYHFYAALARAASCSPVPAEQDAPHLESLTAHYRHLENWAQHCPENFEDRKTLVAAEIARLEGRVLDAERLYEQAIGLAREHGFIQNEGLANELAARFHAARGFATIGDAYLRNARSCYVRWGADGKVRQLDQTHAQLRQALSRPDSAVATSAEQLDLATVAKVSQAVSGEIDLRRLINTLMVTALEHAGGERGLLILARGEEMRIEAEAATIHDAVRLRQERVTTADLPESVLHYVIRTQDSVLLDDASEQNPYSGDEYIRRNHCRSILCLPLAKQARLIGVLYLENNLTPHVFTPARIAVLRLLASQAAFSLENARLYTDLQHAEALLADGQRLSHTGSFSWHVSSGKIAWSDESFRIFEYDPATKPTIEMVLDRVHPDDVAVVQQVIDHAATDKQGFDFEHRLLMPNGLVKHLHVVAHAVTDEPGQLRFMGALMDITPYKQARAALERSENRYRHLFRDMPVALWQLDAQPLIAFFKDLRAKGVEDLSVYIDDHPDFLRRAAELSIIEEANDYAVQMFGARDQRDLLGSMQWVWRESPNTLRRAIESRFRGEERFQETTKLPTLDGRVIDVLYTVARPHTADKVGITLISLVDLTERVRAQEMLQQVQADFAHMNRVSMMGELAASLSHEITQPIASARNNARAAQNFLDMQPPDLGEVREALSCVVGDTDRAGDMIYRIRDHIKKAPLQKERFDLNEAINEVIVLGRSAAIKNGVSVQTRLSERLFPVHGDRVQLQQVILNLLLNAVEAMGSVEAKPRDLLISTEQDRTGVLVAVRDCGPGLDPSHLERVFVAFYTTKSSGMGMGLSICRSIIEAHGGRLWAGANEPRGAVFQFTLPSPEGSS